jgi:hypothetical protein
MSGGSEGRFGDAVSVHALQHGVVDHASVERWLDALGVRNRWDRLLAEATPPATGHARPAAKNSRARFRAVPRLEPRLSPVLPGWRL